MKNLVISSVYTNKSWTCSNKIGDTVDGMFEEIQLIILGSLDKSFMIYNKKDKWLFSKEVLKQCVVSIEEVSAEEVS